MLDIGWARKSIPQVNFRTADPLLIFMILWRVSRKMRNYSLVPSFESYSLLRPEENLGFPIVKKLNELFLIVPEVAIVQEISCMRPYRRISFNPSNRYDSYFNQPCFVEKVHFEGKWNCPCPSIS